MHHSRLHTVMIDCHGIPMDQAVAFWSGALGLEPDPADKATDRYRRLIGRDGVPVIGLQRVDDHSAFHLDIETDDVEAEVARLEALGAVRKYKIHTWWVMRAPTGHDFCVVRPQAADFPGDAARWG